MSNCIVEQIRADRAEDFLELISPHNDLWHRCDWAFRGHRNADWTLIPSVFRDNIWRAAMAQHDCALDASMPIVRTIPEFVRIDTFFHAVDKAGLGIPGDSQMLRSSRTKARLFVGKTRIPSWPTPDLLPLVALAQHYGVPTRLIDWTWNSRVAAYFACEDAARSPTADQCMCVWALKLNFVRAGWLMADTDDLPRVDIVTAAKSTNPNLSAQAGLFTVDRDAVGPDDSFDLRLESRFDEAARPEQQGHGPDASILGMLPALRKIVLPHEQAGRLLRMLAREEVSAASVFPGYAGVKRSIDEYQYHRS